ncbi:GNAT family N-acetyltransferase [Microbacterium sp. SA39]|uniref:GNAT family N-acetyltransferase n=1 Tax=Microbacterium sp. SA39 TaxID=1263625 RepID=UPI0005FA61DE|nr:GNAT family N-acetyltransferase [Microbacterium sp. SA39]KJQ55517.1 Acetyltransferase (GNAT) family protein [Microbacterium sp. SA39]
MTLRSLSSADRPLLREATLANMNWNGSRFTFGDIDAAHELSHYFTSFPAGRDFGLADQDGDVVKAVAWLVFLPAEEPGYGFVDAETPELSITTFADHRGQGIGSRLLSELISQARSRGLHSISLSVEDGNGARRLYGRVGFEVVGRNGGSDTMLLALT